MLLLKLSIFSLNTNTIKNKGDLNTKHFKAAFFVLVLSNKPTIHRITIMHVCTTMYCKHILQTDLSVYVCV